MRTFPSRSTPLGLGATLAVLVAMPPVAAIGQVDDGSPAETRLVAVEVSGTSTLVDELEAGTISIEGGVARQRGVVLVTSEASSDPRASGRGTITLDVDAYADARGVLGATQVRSGSMRLENEAGEWFGRFAGRLSGGRFIQTYWLRGEEDYAGLTYVVTAGGNGPIWATEGLIYPGEPPQGVPLGPVEAPASDDDPLLAVAERG
jgi:hypothetical protein